MEKTAAAEAAALDIAELPFSDLLLLVSPEVQEEERLRRLVATVGAALGPGGAGLLAVADVPRAGALRRRLLPLARRLALMDHPSRTQLLKMHGLGSDVPLKKPDRHVSSFARLLRYSGGKPNLVRSMNKLESINKDRLWDDRLGKKAHGFDEFNSDDFENLGELFKELGLCMMELGVLVARACDIVTGGDHQLEQSVTDCGTAKARLIHYHSELDNIILKKTSTNRKVSINKLVTMPHHSYSQISTLAHGSYIKSEDETMVMTTVESNSQDILIQDRASRISLSNLWQEWHYDYGILTILTSPLFLSSSLGEENSISQECPHPNGHTHLQLFDKRKIFSVRCPPESFVVQVGEAADILSGGKLRSTLHAVSRPLSLANISRETFVVFLQPSWDKTLCNSGYSIDCEDESNNHKELAIMSDGSAGSCDEQHILMQEILRKVPPLSLRLKEGMTFAEFSRQTTKQYYGGGGVQQNNSAAAI